MAIDTPETETPAIEPTPVVRKPYVAPIVYQATAVRDAASGINNGPEILILLS
jgi:hypothetical protein